MTDSIRAGPAEVFIVPALSDNYAYVVAAGGEALLVDAPEAEPVTALLGAHRLKQTAVLVTHHHGDHIFGLEEIRERGGVRVHAPDDSRIPGVDVVVRDGEIVTWGPARFRVIATPGHSRTHVAYYEESMGLLFSGDALFVGGCGRLLEGTAGEMHDTLRKLVALPESTRVFCGHDYTEDNLRFACSVENNRADLVAELERVRDLRRAGKPTVPSTVGWERRFNVFARAGSVQELARLRRLKDSFA